MCPPPLSTFTRFFGTNAIVALFIILRTEVTEAFPNFYDSGVEMVEGAPLLHFDPPVLWDVDTSLWDYVENQGLSARTRSREK